MADQDTKGKKINVLIIDDEENFLFAMQMWLSAKGYGVETASRGKEGIEKIRIRMPDIVFLDVAMPDMDGIDTLVQIRTVSRDLPVVMITAFGLVPKLGEAERYGVMGIFRKSQDFSKAAELIENAIKKINE